MFTPAAPSVTAVSAPSALTDRPNIVLVLADDLDMSLLRKMPNVESLANSGVTFDNSFVVDSLCCPSRAATFTGMFPHNTGVRVNTSTPGIPDPTGGYAAFQDDEDSTFAVSLQQRGYHTAFMGKYMNQYPVEDGAPLPPGWDQWNAVSRGGYRGWQFAMTTTVPGSDVVLTKSYTGLEDDQYVQTVLGERAVEFIDGAEPGTEPYLLEVAPYGTHSRVGGRAHPGDPRFPPAFQDRPNDIDTDGDCGGVGVGVSRDCTRLSIRHLDGFGQTTEDNRPYSRDGSVVRPGWLPVEPVESQDVRHLSRDYRNRARMAQSVDRIVGDVVAAAQGEPTYVVFSSDNGFRLGQFQLGRGKGSAYTPDIQVPLIVGGEAVPDAMRGSTRDEVVLNVDLASTFEDIAGKRRPTSFHDGSSLLPLVRSERSVPWREMGYVEHVQPTDAQDNPDQEASTNRVPTFWAVRSADALFVETRLRVSEVGAEPVWKKGFEYYTGLSERGAFEDTNRYQPGDRQIRQMRAALHAYRTCVGKDCRAITAQ